MTQFNLYIGANNRTGQVEIDKIVRYIGHVFSGFTIVDSIGYWQGKAEKSIVVTIFTDEKDRWFMIEYVKGLATMLMQDCIILQTIKADNPILNTFDVSKEDEPNIIDFVGVDHNPDCTGGIDCECDKG
jgi:hypothetical protein